MVSRRFIIIFEIISFAILYAPHIFAATGMIDEQTFILICKLLFSNISVIWCFTFKLIMFEYSLKGTCDDKEEWCSFQVPDCNQMRIKRTCLKSCNSCLGNYQLTHLNYMDSNKHYRKIGVTSLFLIFRFNILFFRWSV